MPTTKCAMLAGVVVASLSGAAFAQGGPALTIRDVNLRTQPTTNSPSLGIIPGGSTIQAGPCGGGWCQAFLGDRVGFISQVYLDFGGPPAYGPAPVYAPAPPPPAVYGPPVVYGPPPPYWGWRRW